MLCLDEVQVTLLFCEKKNGKAEKCFSEVSKVAADADVTVLMGDYEQGLAVGTNEGCTYYWEFEGEKDKVIEFLNKIAGLQR